MPSPIKQVIRWILLFHGLANIAQGVYSVLYPSNFASTAGPGFMSASPMAIQSIGLGSVGVGVYSALGAWSNHRRFYAVTAPMRVLFGCVALSQWGWEENKGVVMYEWAVAVIAALGALA